MKTAPNRNATRDAAFTIIELLCVMLLVSVFAAMVFPAITALQRAGRRHYAATITADLMLATEQYRTTYGHWPLHTAQSDDDIIYAADATSYALATGTLSEQSDLIAALTTNLLHNPRNQSFIEIDTEYILENRLVDPWGEPILLLADGDGDGRIIVDLTHNTTHARIQLNTNAQCIAVSWGDSPNMPVFSFSTE